MIQAKKQSRRAAVGIDDWKQPTFERILTEAGFSHSTGPGVTKDTRIITVYYQPADFGRLTRTLQRCQREAAEFKPKS